MQKEPVGKRCETYSIGVISVASSFSVASLLFLAVSVSTNNWDTVTFDFNLVNASVMQSASSYYGPPKPLYADTARTQLTGMVLLTSNSTGYCLLNLYSSLWTLCDKVNTDDALNAAYDAYCKNFSLLIANNSCFDYIAGYTNARDLLDVTENTSESQIMKMQNNAMACCIVVLICVITSVLTGLIGVLAKIVPSIMVTGVLHLTAGIFVIFSNSIVHEKASRMTRRPQIDGCSQCVCYSLVKTPEQFCNSTYRSVSIGWSVATSWVSAFLFLASSIAWFYLTRRVRIDKAKSMI